MNKLPPINRLTVDKLKPIATAYAIPLPKWIVSKKHLQGLPQEVADYFDSQEKGAMLNDAPCLFSNIIDMDGDWYGVKLDVPSIVFYLEIGQDTQAMIDHVNNFPKELYGVKWGDFGARYAKVVAINYARERRAKGKAIKKTMVSYELEGGEIQEVEIRNDGGKHFSYRIR